MAIYLHSLTESSTGKLRLLAGARRVSSGICSRDFTASLVAANGNPLAMVVVVCFPYDLTGKLLDRK